MSETLTAIFDGGAFVPDQATHFVAGARVRLVVESLGDAPALSIDEFDAVADDLSVRSDGSRLTRDQLHDRG
jgi:hypothetical protein